MNREWLKTARGQRGWTQAEAAAQLSVSQGYLSLLETGRRQVSASLLPALRRVYGMPATALPPRETTLADHRLAAALAALGYEPLAYLRGRALRNPSEVVLAALRQRDLESRLAEALPWVVLHYADMDWSWLLERAKVHDVQNRLGYVLALARDLAERRQDAHTAARLRELERKLERSRLAREDTLCQDSMTEAERRWLREQRSARARHWNLLTDLEPEYLAYAT